MSLNFDADTIERSEKSERRGAFEGLLEQLKRWLRRASGWKGI